MAVLYSVRWIFNNYLSVLSSGYFQFLANSSNFLSACQRRGHWFEPWSEKIPHAAEQLSPCATTTESAL